ncbi:MAG: flagellar basal body rod protein FlgC [Verrucomicrobiia bacterium]|jgi:flagellar basal-body rod protein FlgC
MINLIPGIQSTVSALEAERVRMEVISQNIANAYTTRGLDGRPYQRQQVVFERVLNTAMGLEAEPATVRVARVVKDNRPMPKVYSPGHPDADKNGMVTMPNVNIHEEMVDMISANRSYEANLAVIKTARNMVMQTLSIGKR